MVNQRLLLLDGHSLAFRSFFALPKDSFRTDQGQYTNGIHGFINTLLKLYADVKPTHVAVAFDLSGGTFRTKEYAAYKGGRADTPEEFEGQIPLIQEVLDALGIEWITKDQFEADDIIATLADRGEKAGMKVVVSSGDKDVYQLVSDAVTVLYPMPRSQMLEMTPDVVKERTGVPPELYSDLAALVGEKADNLPGVPGVGAKTAQKWIDTYGGLEGIIEHADEIGGKVGDSLRENLEQVKLNRRLNELLRDMPLEVDFDELKPRGVDREAVHQLFDTLDFTSLRGRVLAELPLAEGDSEMASESLAGLEAVTAAPGDLAAWLAAHASERLGLFLVGRGQPRRGDIEMIAVASSSGDALVADRVDLSEEDVRAFTTWCEDSEAIKVVHEAKAAWHAIKGSFDAELAGVGVDTELAAYILHPDQRSYDLNDLIVRHVGMVLPDMAADELDLGLSLGGGAVDGPAARAWALLPLADVLEREVDARGSTELLHGIERPLMTVLARMEHVGIAADTAVFDDLHKEFDSRVTRAAESAYAAIGHEVNLSSPKQLQVVLFDELGLPPTRKTKSGYTTNAEALTDLFTQLALREDDRAAAGREFLGQLLEHRDAIKLKQSVEGLSKSVLDDGRIHTSFQQTVAATGRLSSTEPNLQNIHARTEEGQRIREAFVPGDGYESIMTVDYSQIEMRLMAHQSGDAALIQAFIDGEDLHSYVAGRVYGIDPTEVSPAQRNKIKAMSYGLAYGLSAFGLSRQLRIERSEAQQLMNDYFERFGAVRNYLESVVAQARRDGYTSTILGRRRYLPDLTSDNRQRREAAERMALNAPIQGSAADIIKIAMLGVDRALTVEGLASRVLLQVHDELVLEIASGEEEKVRRVVTQQMESAVDLSVPLSVGVGVGPSWRAAAH
ncbi:DNA polymerase I [Flaviflexus salsibiostraticola]|uniref:DNA polymerase I n=1 Tax=Flaviflexus salsibiostraticola TaxID=1282737 RepID=A0A3S8Z7C2_9ACTO|nr:DNA polymerase I [Flaviflexus salsibiostraticola]AZN29417.1 DNA polymerase I [Flaviflexus salsibiostraticola]